MFIKNEENKEEISKYKFIWKSEYTVTIVFVLIFAALAFNLYNSYHEKQVKNAEIKKQKEIEMKVKELSSAKRIICNSSIMTKFYLAKYDGKFFVSRDKNPIAVMDLIPIEKCHSITIITPSKVK